MKTYIEIVEYSSGQIVKTVEVSSKSERMIAKIERALNINLNHDSFFTRVKNR